MSELLALGLDGGRDASDAVRDELLSIFDRQQQHMDQLAEASQT